MKICEDCGREYQDYLDHCPSCLSTNYRIKEKKTETLKYYRSCNSCGKNFDYGMRACPHCGSVESSINIKNSPSNYNYKPLQYVKKVDEGSFATGFLLVFFLGIIPLLVICASGKEQTRVGATVAGVISLIVGFILAIIRISILLG